MDFESMSFAQLLEYASTQHGHRLAFVGPGGRHTYREVQDRVRRVAGGLSRLGIRRGDHVCLLMPNRQEWIDCFLALGYLGAVAVPVNTRYTAREIEYTLVLSDAVALVAADQFAGIHYMDMLREIAPELPLSRPGELNAARVPHLRTVVCVGQDPYPGCIPYADLTAEPGAAGVPVSAGTPGDTVLIQFTSGTTAFPKGAMLTQQQVIRDAYVMSGRLETTAADRWISPLPFFHVGGSVLSILLTFTRGACLVYPPRFDPEAVLQLIQQERCTAIAGVQTMWSDLLERYRRGNYDTSSLRTGWGIVAPETMRQLVQLLGIERMSNGYGLSETCSSVAASEPDDPLEVRATTCGLPHPGVEFAIVDPVTGDRLPPGQPGEILIRGWVVMQGYYKQPAETAQALDADGWLHTGDRGYLRPDGRLVFGGRIKDMLRVGGENVSAEEVEAALLRHPAVVQAAVIAVPDRRLGEVPLAYVQVDRDKTVAAGDLIQFARTQLSRFKVPRFIRFIDAFPTTSSGKIQKFKLREQAAREFGDFPDQPGG